jgi:hypothetical protein
VLLVALAGCGLVGGGGSADPTPSARAGFGGPATPAPVVSDVTEAFFRTPSHNIICNLSPGTVRCDIARKTWTPPPKPATCEGDWANGLYISAGKPGLTCAGDTLIGAAKQTLDYGQALRSGTVTCNSESNGLTCTDEKTAHGFKLAAAEYSLF